MKPTRQQLARIHEPWPEGGLEDVGQCPVCGSKEREVLYKSLRDWVFYCSPGKWVMYCCNNCGSAYLDPRPTPDTIHLAYERYFTHEPVPEFSNLKISDKFRRVLANGYRNWRYGTQDNPSSRLGIFAAWLMPDLRAIIDAGMRHLPKPRPDQRLLDVGCGNGGFLLRARSAGWDVVGVDFDPKAVETAREKGLNVFLGGIEVFVDAEESQFDVITLSHVIEHVHDPNYMLRECFRLIKPGGYLWIETPILNAEGHRLYGENWRGLEPPRHIVIFTEYSLRYALCNAGFKQIDTMPYRPMCKQMFSASEAIAEKRNPWKAVRLSRSGRYHARLAEAKARRESSLREFITFKAWK